MTKRTLTDLLAPSSLPLPLSLEAMEVFLSRPERKGGRGEIGPQPRTEAGLARLGQCTAAAATGETEKPSALQHASRERGRVPPRGLWWRGRWASTLLEFSRSRVIAVLSNDWPNLNMGLSRHLRAYVGLGMYLTDIRWWRANVPSPTSRSSWLDLSR